MLPTVVASELRDAVSAYLRSAFPFATPFFQQSAKEAGTPTLLIDNLLRQPGELFQGPYLDIKLPFRLADSTALPFRKLQLGYTPYQHQIEAFQRLAGDAPQSTIVATGTGSGKTECFMLPVLDDCLKRREQGIKTIIIYPMNALATDQARRFAAEVSKLDTRLTVGLFVGGDDASAATTMGPDNVITCKKTLRQNPPDILLTNYKMLDFLLIRPKDHALWRYNRPGMLRYLVVDELHTFDGAQGTDLACLIRRLRDRLDVGPELACVGTSATIGSESRQELLDYASQIFATAFDQEAIITESRQSVDEYLAAPMPQETTDGGEKILYFNWPARDERRLDPALYERFDEYLFHQARLWFAELLASDLPRLNATDQRTRAEASVRLGLLLRQHQVFHQLVRDTARIRSLDELAQTWQQKLQRGSTEEARLLIISLTSLIAAARLWAGSESSNPQKGCKPFLQLRQQLWLRELRRMVCSVPTGDDLPVLRFSDDLKDTRNPLHLPLLHCRECHLGAWGGVIKKGDSHITGDVQLFYQKWFGHSAQSALMVPLVTGQTSPGPEKRFCPHCFRLQAVNDRDECVECARSDLLRVWLPNMLKTSQGSDTQTLECHHDCPECGARDSLVVVGYRAATLISVMTGRLFATPYNDDFKLIAFSDSVQDAAHRAGFLGANTWRLVVRQAMAGWLRRQSVGFSLREMADLLPAYWRDRIQDDAHFVGLFIAPNMEWNQDYAHLTEHGRLPTGSDLPQQVAKRLAWECLSEFGRRSRTGRSLERTGVAAVGLDTQRFARDLAALAERLRNEVESLRELGDERFTAFVLGWLTHLRRIGAVYDPALDGYLAHKGREYLFTFLPWMPGFGRSQLPPAPVTLKHLSNNFETLFHGSRDTWSVRWLKKTLGHESLFVAAESRQIFTILLQVLTRAGWLVEKAAGDEPMWMLNPHRLQIERDSHELQCTQCRHSLRTSRELLAGFEGMPCPRASCGGEMQPVAGAAPRRDYGITEPRRLVPSEHTGLLPRDVREAVEHSFIHGHEPWDVNLLSATPTLEMGIDIGDLSSVFLCSVPPAQANYLQRIGRAGRKDGNALAVTVANGENHDLYFYQEPLEMIAGWVHTPGVFLKAIAVLERQLIAYCFDRWAATGIDATAIPGILKKVLDAVQYQHQDKFPYTLISFIAQHRPGLLSGFLGLFDHLDDQAKAYLASFINDSGETAVSHRLVERLRQMVAERESLLRKTKQLKVERERLKKLPDDESTQEEILAVDHERGALLSLLSSINNQPVLNFFTDEGLLPNYAFPEEGVTLRSVILRRRSKGEGEEGQSAFQKTSYTFQRPAQTALAELAPESRFYAISHEMEIDQIDLQLAESELWRFCDRCQFTQRVDLEDKHSACPRCGSAQWADGGQRHRVLKLRQVYSTVDDRRSRIGDDSEQRAPSFFNRQMLVDIPDEGRQGGFRIKSDSLPFGFEFLARATLRDINFGPMGGESHTFSVAGRELARQGFRICRHCGKVQKGKPKKYEQAHAYTCKLRKHPQLEKPEDYFESLYLYRELNSEAIRILLPLAEVAYSDEKLHSFIAALNLGLKRYFRGNVHHLEVTDMLEPPKEGSSERIYLVIYDRIPGGTGYLKELMRSPDNLMQVLALARESLTHCSCVDDEHKDGCYRCILAYRNSRQMPTISRRTAVELLDDILSLRDQLEPVESMGEINTNALIESKLEQKFVEALASLPGARLSRTLVNGKQGELLTLPGDDGRPVAWQLEHQVKRGPNEGVAITTEVDVMLTPSRAEDAARYRPIAVYLDGLQYHHDILADDVSKRAALLLSGDYWVWSLGWEDLPSPGKPARPHSQEIMRGEGIVEQQMSGMWHQLAERSGWVTPAEHAKLNSWGGLDWLSHLLSKPSLAADELMQRAAYRAFSLLAPNLAKDDGIRQALVRALMEIAPDHISEELGVEMTERIPGGFLAALGNAVELLDVVTTVPMMAIKSNDPINIAESTRLHICFDDRECSLTEAFKDAWRAFWHAANQLQFLPGFSLATRKGVADGRLARLWRSSTTRVARKTEEMASETGAEQAWAEVFEFSLLDEAVISALVAAEYPVPEVGVDIATHEGEVILEGGVIELCWRAQCVAVVTELPSMVPHGWRLIQAGEHMMTALNRLREQGVF